MRRLLLLFLCLLFHLLRCFKVPNECLHPYYIRDQNLYVPCGRCPNCRSRARYDLSTRIFLETALAGSAYFITLTYNEDNLPCTEQGKPCFNKKQVQDFMKRVRKKLEPSRLRFFLTCEYGDGKEAKQYLQQYGTEFGRSHYHAIFICDNKRPLREVRDIVQASWPFGYSSVSSCSMARIQYATQYALKDEDYLYKKYEKGDPSKPFRLFSLKPGLGSGFGKDEKPVIGFLNDYLFNDGLHFRDRLTVDGKSRGIPRYWKDRIDPSIAMALKEKGLEFLQEKQQELAETRLANCILASDGKEIWRDGKLLLDFTKDNEILRKRRAIRQLRKSRKDSL